MKILILAGGSGTRLWPLSRGNYPKQFIKIRGIDESLFQKTFKRGLELATADDIYVITSQKYKFLVMGGIEELGIKYKEENILVEPEAKNTLPAIYYGVHTLKEKGHDDVVVFSSDHLIAEEKKFINIIKESKKLIKNKIVIFGIKPDNPNTGYGYIQPGEKIENGNIVDKFREKPNYETAVSYLEKGYLWNSGIFMFNSLLFENEVLKYCKNIYEAFEENKNIEDKFKKIEKGISIDYAIMEKTEKAAVVSADIGWTDLGSFDSLYDTIKKDKEGNVIFDEDIAIDSKNNLIYSEPNKIVSTIGVEDLLIIDEKDALLICKREESQKVKNVIEILKERKDIRTEYKGTDYRPWGSYKILDEEKEKFKIKRISVLPGKKISYQLHHHRSEHWVVLKGMAKVTIEENEKFVKAGESVFMKAGQKHRLENPGKIPLEIIEVQLGEYLEEDDIIRFEDLYGRI